MELRASPGSAPGNNCHALYSRLNPTLLGPLPSARSGCYLAASALAAAMKMPCALVHDQIVLTIDHNIRAAVFGEEHALDVSTIFPESPAGGTELPGFLFNLPQVLS